MQIESALPSISRPIMSLDGNEDAIVGALKQSLVMHLFLLAGEHVAGSTCFFKLGKTN